MVCGLGMPARGRQDGHWHACFRCPSCEIIASPFTAAAASLRGGVWFGFLFLCTFKGSLCTLPNSFLFHFHLKIVSEQLHGNEKRADVCDERFSPVFFKGTPVASSWHNRA